MRRPVENQQAFRGWSLVEILVAMTVFSLATVGLYLAMQGVNEAMTVAMSRNIEAAYVNGLIGEVNPLNPAIETAYDVWRKTALRLPDNQTVHYTRRVETRGEQVDISVYLYRNAADREPYRQFLRQVVLQQVGLALGESRRYYKDVLGRVWSPGGFPFVGRPGAYRNGYLQAEGLKRYRTPKPVLMTPDPALYQQGVEGNHLRYAFNVLPNHPYRVTLGFAEVEEGVRPGGRVMDIRINGRPVDRVDVVAQTGRPLTALLKTYRVLPAISQAPVAHIGVEVLPAAPSTRNPRLSFIVIERIL